VCAEQIFAETGNVITDPYAGFRRAS
jgi:hypothetical protein